MAIYRFIFFSMFSLAIFWIGHLTATPESLEFLEAWELWQEPIFAGMIGGIGLACLGVYILLNRIVFMSLALAQGAGLGIFLTFWICAILGYHLDHSSIPLLSGFALAGLTAIIFSFLRRNSNYSEESLIGVLYVIGSGLILILGDRITQGIHDKDNLLFGNVVAVSSQDLSMIGIVVSFVLLMLFLFRREFTYVSADPTFMKTKGLSTNFWMGLLFLLFTICITVSLKVLGALPVFALMLIPPFIGSRSAQSMGDAFLISMLIGSIMPALGYYYSYLFSLPTGAAIVLVGIFYLIASLVESFAFSSNKLA